MAWSPPPTLLTSRSMPPSSVPALSMRAVTPSAVLRSAETAYAPAALYRSLLGPTGSARVIEHVRQRTTAAARIYPLLPATDGIPERGAADPSDGSRDVPAAFVAGALLGVATDWLQRGCPRPPREMNHPDRATPDRPTQQHRDGERVTDGAESACVRLCVAFGDDREVEH